MGPGVVAVCCVVTPSPGWLPPWVGVCDGSAVGPSHVAVFARGAQIGGVVGWSAVGEGDDVVDVGCDGGAAFASDLADALVSFEDGEADLLPGSTVGGFGHQRVRSEQPQR